MARGVIIARRRQLAWRSWRRKPWLRGEGAVAAASSQENGGISKAANGGARQGGVVEEWRLAIWRRLIILGNRR